jgi:hypothetical protein
LDASDRAFKDELVDHSGDFILHIRLSDLDNILLDASSIPPPPAHLFGVEEAQNWCYYFEKADLARQSGDWTEVVDLWGEAGGMGLSPGNAYEYYPFIEGFARTGDYEMVERLAGGVMQIDRSYAASLCKIIGRIEQDVGDAGATHLSALKDKLDCANR